MSQVTELSHEDQVALWAGRIVRKEAQIESMLRSIYYNLSGPGGLSWAVVPSGFMKVLEDVRDMLKASEVTDGYKNDCLAALVRLRDAHVRRNRVVHDQWIQQEPGKFTSTPKGVSGGVSKPPLVWDVTEFEDCYTELVFCWAMISGIYWSSMYIFGDTPSEFAQLLPANRETIAGRFEMASEYSWNYTDAKFLSTDFSRRLTKPELEAQVRQIWPSRPRHLGR